MAKVKRLTVTLITAAVGVAGAAIGAWVDHSFGIREQIQQEQRAQRTEAYLDLLN